MTENLAKLSNRYKKAYSILQHNCSIMLRTLALLLALLGTTATRAQQQPATTLATTLQHIADTAGAQVGVAAIDMATGIAVGINVHDDFPMMSTYKFPLALAVLKLVDQGRLSLTQQVYIPAITLDTNTWSPMLKDHPDQGFFSLSIQELLAYTIGLSDNNATDILFAQVGGTAFVNDYIHHIGPQDIQIAATEAEMAKDWHLAYNNRCTPMAMARLLAYFGSDSYAQLTKPSRDLLMDMMTYSLSGPNRIKGMLPPGTPVAHKTGTGGMNAEGITAAINDVGIITLPDGRHVALAIFIANYKGTAARAEWTIATMARAVYNHYTTP